MACFNISVNERADSCYTVETTIGDACFSVDISDRNSEEPPEQNTYDFSNTGIQKIIACVMQFNRTLVMLAEYVPPNVPPPTTPDVYLIRVEMETTFSNGLVKSFKDESSWDMELRNDLRDAHYLYRYDTSSFSTDFYANELITSNTRAKSTDYVTLQENKIIDVTSYGTTDVYYPPIVHPGNTLMDISGDSYFTAKSPIDLKEWCYVADRNGYVWDVDTKFKAGWYGNDCYKSIYATSTQCPNTDGSVQQLGYYQDINGCIGYDSTNPINFSPYVIDVNVDRGTNRIWSKYDNDDGTYTIISANYAATYLTIFFGAEHKNSEYIDTPCNDATHQKFTYGGMGYRDSKKIIEITQATETPIKYDGRYIYISTGSACNVYKSKDGTLVASHSIHQDLKYLDVDMEWCAQHGMIYKPYLNIIVGFYVDSATPDFVSIYNDINDAGR